MTAESESNCLMMTRGVEIPCSSYTEAIDLVKEHQHDVTVAKIVDRDGDVVFTSADMEIEVWESIWNQEKRREAISVEERACPYDSISCFPDDLCVQCEMDKISALHVYN